MTGTLYTYRVRFNRVIDGDNIEVDIDLGYRAWMHNWSIRLYDIDAPEMFGAKATPEGKLAKLFVEEWVGTRTELTLVSRKYDHRESAHKRVLGDIYRDGDPVRLSEALVVAGHAKWMAY